MKIYVTQVECLNHDTKRIYTLTDGSMVIEHTNLPGKSRFNYFDHRGNFIHKSSKRMAMKKVVEHPKYWRVRRCTIL